MTYEDLVDEIRSFLYQYELMGSDHEGGTPLCPLCYNKQIKYIDRQLIQLAYLQAIKELKEWNPEEFEDFENLPFWEGMGCSDDWSHHG